MEFENLANVIFGKLKPKLENHRGLSVFAKKRAKFECWLKVELCDSLSKRFKDVAPERNRIDITFENWAIELKTINTNIRYKNVENKTKTITKNIQGVIKDIEKLNSTNYLNKAVLFVVFPITHNNKHWQVHIKKIRSHIEKIKHRDFVFKDEIPGVIYFGLI